MTRHDDIEGVRTDATIARNLALYQRYLDSLDDNEVSLEYSDPDWRDTREADIPRRQ